MNFIELLLRLSFVILLNSSLGNGKRTPRILRGNDTKPGDFKYMVAIMHNRVNLTCGGGIIDERMILSAAHCFIDKDTDEFMKGQFSILAGTNDINNKHDPRRVDVEVEKIVVPRAYKFENTNDDIAVIKLKTRLEVKKNDLQILRLAKPADIGNSETRAIVAGFGAQKLEEVDGKLIGRVDGKLHSADVEVASNEDCVQTFREKDVLCGFMIIDDDNEDYDTTEPHGICSGDSGSPLVIESNTVVGVVAYSDHTCDEQGDQPTYYTSVTAYSNFVDEAMVALRSDAGSTDSTLIRMSQ